MRELRSSDVRAAKNGRRNLSSLKSIMNFMIAEAKRQKIYSDNPDEEEVDTMFKNVSGAVLSLSHNKRCETFSWHSFSSAVAKERRRLKTLQ